jgi:hypothetical protein
VRLAGVLDDVQVVLRAISRIGSMSAGQPWMWTGMMARVRGVIAASILAGSIVYVFGSMSTKTGMAIWCITQEAVARNV